MDERRKAKKEAPQDFSKAFEDYHKQSLAVLEEIRGFSSRMEANSDEHYTAFMTEIGRIREDSLEFKTEIRDKFNSLWKIVLGDPEDPNARGIIGRCTDHDDHIKALEAFREAQERNTEMLAAERAAARKTLQEKEERLEVVEETRNSQHNSLDESRDRRRNIIIGVVGAVILAITGIPTWLQILHIVH